MYIFNTCQHFPIQVVFPPTFASMSTPFAIGRFLVAPVLLFGCTTHTDSATEPAAKELAARQELIRNLATHIQYYHEEDTRAAQPDWDGGGIYSFTLVPGKKAKMYHGRAAVRTALNRMLDSLKNTGSLHMGNREDGTDTLAYQPSSTDIITTTNTSRVKRGVDGDSTTITRP